MNPKQNKHKVKLLKNKYKENFSKTASVGHITHWWQEYK